MSKRLLAEYLYSSFWVMGNVETNKYDKNGLQYCIYKYTEYEMQLEKDGCLFLYTDGVPEATDAKECLFGTDRMIEALNKDPNASPEVLLNNVKKATEEFVGEAPQFDDLTMLAINWHGKTS